MTFVPPTDEAFPAGSSVRISSFCTADHCVGVAFTPSGVRIVDTKGAPVSLHFGHDEWAAFVAGVKGGEFDVPG